MTREGQRLPGEWRFAFERRPTLRGTIYYRRTMPKLNFKTRVSPGNISLALTGRVLPIGGKEKEIVGNSIPGAMEGRHNSPLRVLLVEGTMTNGNYASGANGRTMPYLSGVALGGNLKNSLLVSWTPITPAVRGLACSANQLFAAMLGSGTKGLTVGWN